MALPRWNGALNSPRQENLVVGVVPVDTRHRDDVQANDTVAWS